MPASIDQILVILQKRRRVFPLDWETGPSAKPVTSTTFGFGWLRAHGLCATEHWDLALTITYDADHGYVRQIYLKQERAGLLRRAGFVECRASTEPIVANSNVSKITKTKIPIIQMCPTPGAFWGPARQGDWPPQL